MVQNNSAAVILLPLKRTKKFRYQMKSRVFRDKIKGTKLFGSGYSIRDKIAYHLYAKIDDGGFAKTLLNSLGLKNLTSAKE